MPAVAGKWAAKCDQKEEPVAKRGGVVGLGEGIRRWLFEHLDLTHKLLPQLISYLNPRVNLLTGPTDRPA